MDRNERLGLSGTVAGTLGDGGVGYRSDVGLDTRVEGGNYVAQTGSEGQAGQIGRTAREPGTGTGGADRSAPTGDAGPPHDPVESIRRGTERIGQLATDFATEFSTLLRASISSGAVTAPIASFDDWFSLADGWYGKRIYTSVLRDIYVMHVQAGMELPRHYKLQVKHVYVVAGGVYLTIDGQGLEYKAAGTVFTVPANTPHLLTGSTGDSLLIVTYEPPFMQG